MRVGPTTQEEAAAVLRRLADAFDAGEIYFRSTQVMSSVSTDYFARPSGKEVERDTAEFTVDLRIVAVKVSVIELVDGKRVPVK